jgi:hypothetical protein
VISLPMLVIPPPIDISPPITIPLVIPKSLFICNFVFKVT